MGRQIATIGSLPGGASGYADPWWLVEGQNVYNPPVLNPEPGAFNPPPPDPRSGVFYLGVQARVFDEPTDEHFMPVARDKNGGLLVDFGADPKGPKLNHRPRMENPGILSSGQWAACRVENLDVALTPPPKEEKADEGEAESKPKKAAGASK